MLRLKASIALAAALFPGMALAEIDPKPAIEFAKAFRESLRKSGDAFPYELQACPPFGTEGGCKFAGTPGYFEIWLQLDAANQAHQIRVNFDGTKSRPGLALKATQMLCSHIVAVGADASVKAVSPAIAKAFASAETLGKWTGTVRGAKVSIGRDDRYEIGNCVVDIPYS